MRGAIVQAAIGLTIGIPTAMLCVRFVEAQLYEIKGIDAGTLILAIATLASAAAVAGLIPARKAAAIDPVQALRSE
jgi:ABC-type antimicrobial peptide transport system permease subunit